LRRDFAFGGDGGLGVGPRPGLEFIDAAGRPAVDELFQHIREIGFRAYGIEPPCLDERSKATSPALLAISARAQRQPPLDGRAKSSSGGCGRTICRFAGRKK